MGKDTVQLETAVSTISQENLLEFTSEYGISKALHPKLPRPGDGYLIHAPNPTKVKTGSRPRAAHEVPLLTLTANRVIGMEDPAAATDSSGVPSIIERSLLDFANEVGPEDQETMAPEVPLPEDVPTTRGSPEAGPAERVTATDPPCAGSTRGGKSLAAIELGMGSTRPTHVPQSAPTDVSDPDLLSFVDPRSSKGAATAGGPESENTSFASMVGSPEGVYRPEWGIPNGSLLDTPEACQDLVDHIAPPGYFLELRHLHNDDFLRQYNVNLARQVAMGSQLRLRFEQEAKLLKKSVAQVARRDKRIQARDNEIKNLEALLEAEANTKKATKDKSAKLSKELEYMRALFSDLQVSNDRLSQLVSTLQEQVSGEEKLKAAFEEFKQYEDNRVEQRCAKMDVRMDGLSIDFDEELYPHMLTAIAGRKWMIGRGMRLAVMKCGESVKLRQAFADVVSARIAKGMSEGLKHEACKEEMLLADAIAANVSCTEKKKKCRVVCRTHGVGFAHHARSDGVPLSMPTVIPQGLAILLANAATQTKPDEASPLLRSISLPVMHS
uniref:Transposase (Putative), gypsy type n=1 Tax=Tanacetum cinerariifolium TaxID=118510 RepID=A0A6L2L4T9_TANCI|nr:hypothetical protein [Tanacetum cinerariifolium]